MLADALGRYRSQNALVLGIPRGGVVVAQVIAERLDGQLDIAIARKIGAPFNPELALGAVAADGVPLLDEVMVRRLGVSEQHLEAEVAAQAAEVIRRQEAYRGDRPPPDIGGRVVIVADDGVATGSTMLAVLRYLRRLEPATLVCAVPCGPAETIEQLSAECDEVVCPLTPSFFMAVGQWYRDFHQVSDREVQELLEGS